MSSEEFQPERQVDDRQDTAHPLQRVIRTDLYFSEEVDVLADDLSVVWLQGKDSFSAFQSLFETERWPGLPRFVVSNPIAFLMLLLRQPQARSAENIQRLLFIEERLLERAAGKGGSLPIDILVRAATEINPTMGIILGQAIVVERSPPTAVTLSTLLHSATSASIGIFIGTGVAPDPLAMLITVPGGILLMGAVMGISKGLERGLSRRVEEAIAPAKPKRPRKPKK